MFAIRPYLAYVQENKNSKIENALEQKKISFAYQAEEIMWY